MESNLSASDILALNKSTDGLFGESGGMWLIILILFFGFGNGGFWGGNNGAVSEAELFGVQKDVLTSGCDTRAAIAESKYDTLLGFKDMQAQMADYCCSLKTAIHAEGEETRALITQNRIADLQDQLETAKTAVANSVQTQNILNSLGRYVPYSGYTNYPYPYPYNGTQII